MDKFDVAILSRLQADCSISLNDLAEAVKLGATACWRRVQKLEEAGYIRGRVAVLDRKKLNVGVSVFVSVSTNQHNLQWIESFHEVVADIPEIVEVYRMAGETDYLMRVVVPDIEAYDGVYKRLIQVSGLTDVSSAFAMEQIKYTTELPLKYVK
ncbi:MAG: transcriptional regulator [Candidatus Dactylopiibacterium carminicum]|uniref:Transcriptional regulator n=1 Tax=Candidatus Dactylopiibacterium carminicum TaxID=857335 RepID=A0A272EXT3_9RHOO|nr:Lrp/AsnC family transcriptional regulator [Candidatus Dactylopiibacterium carminicum]KAF7600520.1 Lrp/AsnC family transcriptional regulator [Candidatus Dactylopiibacterium carminicum]PAS94911.1 MAG: transcriptional regulator [Candidatus Dactylopiibacterium carminicum]PAT00526.1 MAG: transcriptional regulator [Candidatus Dactylopiibacterium carminicum]